MFFYVFDLTFALPYYCFTTLLCFTLISNFMTKLLIGLFQCVNPFVLFPLLSTKQTVRETTANHKSNQSHK